MRKLLINMSFDTDGDCDFHDDKGYLNSSWEHYEKNIICDESEFFEKLNELIVFLNTNVYNFYGQHQGLVDFIKNLSIKQIFETDSLDIEDFIDSYQSVLSGNQSLTFSVSLFNQEKEIEDKFELFKKLYEELKDTPQMQVFFQQI